MANDIITGKFCNNDCIFCYAKLGSSRDAIYDNVFREKTTFQVKKILDNFKRKGASAVQIYGGESTIRRDFIEIIGYANKLNLDISI